MEQAYLNLFTVFVSGMALGISIATIIFLKALNK